MGGQLPHKNTPLACPDNNMRARHKVLVASCVRKAAFWLLKSPLSHVPVKESQVLNQERRALVDNSSHLLPSFLAWVGRPWALQIPISGTMGVQRSWHVSLYGCRWYRGSGWGAKALCPPAQASIQPRCAWANELPPVGSFRFTIVIESWEQQSEPLSLLCRDLLCSLPRLSFRPCQCPVGTISQPACKNMTPG